MKTLVMISDNAIRVFPSGAKRSSNFSRLDERLTAFTIDKEEVAVLSASNEGSIHAAEAIACHLGARFTKVNLSNDSNSIQNLETLWNSLWAQKFIETVVVVVHHGFLDTFPNF